MKTAEAWRDEFRRLLDSRLDLSASDWPKSYTAFFREIQDDALRDAVETLMNLRRALHVAAKQFRFYEELHIQNGKREKATTNRKMAEMCEKALLSDNPFIIISQTEDATRKEAPVTYIEDVCERLACNIYSHNNLRHLRAGLKDLLVEFAKEIHSMRFEP